MEEMMKWAKKVLRIIKKPYICFKTDQNERKENENRHF